MSVDENSFIPLILPDKYEPSDWQEEDLKFLENRDYSANWGEMGTRKTTTGLWLADKKIKTVTGNINPIILIVTTRSGKGTYFDAIPKCFDGYRVFDIDSNGADELEFLDNDILRFGMKPVEFWDRTKATNLVTPAIMLAHYHVFLNKGKMLPFLRKLEYAMIIVDEAHRIKEKDNQWTRNIKGLNCYTGYKHVMTGTGFINRPQELWSLLNFLDPKLFSSYNAFRKTFCDEFTNPATGYSFIRGVKPERLEQFRGMRKALGPRRLLRETNPEIGLPVFTPLPVELNAQQRKMYNEIKTQLRAMDQVGSELYVVNILSMLSRLRQICVATPEVVADYYDEVEDRRVQKIKLVEPSSKLDAFMELLESLEWDDEDKNQVVVFSCFKDPLELLQTRLEKRDIPYLWMKESHDDAERYEMWHNTWPKKEHRVFMCTLQLGSESINLSSAKYCVFLDRSWSPKDNNQGVSRVYRPGQTETAQVIHINAMKTTDQRVEKVNEIKQGWFTEVFGEGEEPFQTIEDQFEDLLKSDEDKLIDSLLDSAKTNVEVEADNSFIDVLKNETAKDIISDEEIAEANNMLAQLVKTEKETKIEIVEENGIRKLVL
jgi:hypothetical protein